jgi:hypothetical protein
MTEIINFKSFKQASDVQAFLEARFPIGIATSTEVFSFLEEQRLEHSGLIDNSEYIGTIHQIPFEYTISSAAPAKRIGWLFEAYWRTQFHFNNQRLAKIEVLKSGVGF